MSSVSTEPGAPASSASTQYDAVVVGAGPYGLSVAAHLHGKGLKVAIFGKPLQLWREHVPEGMFLRSHWWMTNLSDPEKKYGSEQFFEQSDYRHCYPVPAQAFIDYGLWFQKQAVPFLDQTNVSSIERSPEKRYVVTLEDGRVVVSTTIVMAVGLGYYQRLPEEYTHLSSELLTHSYAYGDLSRFAGKKVAIIGGGQSAVEYAALLHEASAEAHVISRRPIAWLTPDKGRNRSLIERLRAPGNRVAPGWKYWALEQAPYLFRRLSPERKEHHLKNEHHPSASAWLHDRIIGKVQLHERQVVTNLAEEGSGVDLTLSDTTHLQVDHVILATGYQVDVQRLPMLNSSLVSAIKTYHASPLLNPWFESSVPGLYFVGFSSLPSFGPAYRFVGGVQTTAPRVAGAIARQAAKTR